MFDFILNEPGRLLVVATLLPLLYVIGFFLTRPTRKRGFEQEPRLRVGLVKRFPRFAHTSH